MSAEAYRVTWPRARSRSGSFSTKSRRPSLQWPIPAYRNGTGVPLAPPLTSCRTRERPVAALLDVLDLYRRIREGLKPLLEEPLHALVAVEDSHVRDSENALMSHTTSSWKDSSNMSKRRSFQCSNPRRVRSAFVSTVNARSLSQDPVPRQWTEPGCRPGRRRRRAGPAASASSRGRPTGRTPGRRR